MTLVDTSVWVDHLRAGDAALAELLREGDVLLHPFVFGEVSLGSWPGRAAALSDLRDLPVAIVAYDDEVMRLIEREALFGSGVGYVDAHLLASARLTRATLWTRDRRLLAVAARLGLAINLPH